MRDTHLYQNNDQLSYFGGISKNSESRQALSRGRGVPYNQELISSFDLNDHSDINQVSILAMS